jgi:thymidylate synthase ThyX
MTEIKTPKVTLLTWTSLPLETVYSLWQASKNESPLETPVEIIDKIVYGGPQGQFPREARQKLKEDVRQMFRAIIEQRIPVGESVDFVFMLENVSVSFREQMVRHRIGVKPSLERLGVDIGMVDVQQIPDLADSVWWSQSMRIQDMGKFAEQGNYRVPESILDHPNREALLKHYRATMLAIQDQYNQLVAAGVPMEDARELIPLGAQHRISWKLNISSLQHIIGKRGCWILQLGIWGPVIEGMVNELAEKIDPIFRELVTPPCLKGDKFTGCVYHEENRRRYTGDDALPPCPLHLTKHKLPEFQAPKGHDHAETAQDAAELKRIGIPRVDEMHARAEAYRKFWNRDPYTGVRLPVVR